MSAFARTSMASASMLERRSADRGVVSRRFLVFDEADVLFDDEFGPQLLPVLQVVPHLPVWVFWIMYKLYIFMQCARNSP